MAIKTRLEDMEIGDKIISKYVASSGQVGTFSELGTSTATPIPAASTATPNGSFYWIKVAVDYKGRSILVAEKNIQNNISWDALNSYGISTTTGVQVDLGLDPTQWKTNIRLLTGGTSSATASNSEWDKYIVNGPYPEDDSVWNWKSVRSFTSTTYDYPSNSGIRAVRPNHINDSTATSFGGYSTSSIANSLGFRPVLVAESLTAPIQNKYLIEDGEEVKKCVVGSTENLCTGGEPISSPNPGRTSNPKEHAFDGSKTTSWWSQETGASANGVSWIGYRFPQREAIRKIYINQRTSSGIKSVKIQASNDESIWVDISTESITQNEQILEFESNVSYTSWRLLVNSPLNTNWQWTVFEIEMYAESISWQTIGPAPATRDMFLEHGMEDLSFLNEETISQLSSANPELLCWTDEDDPVRHVTQTVTPGWYPVSSEMPSKEVFISEGHTDLSALPQEAWENFTDDFDVVTYTNKLEGNQSIQVNGLPHGQLVLSETNFSMVDDLTVTASASGVKLIVSGDGGVSWFTYTSSWEPVEATPEEVSIQGMTPEVFNSLTPEDWKEIGSNLRIGYYVEDEGLVEDITVMKEPVATESPSLDEISFTYDALTIEGRLKELENINRINLAKLQFKTNALMASEKYRMHDLVVDTFEEDTLLTVESAQTETITKQLSIVEEKEDGTLQRLTGLNGKFIKKIELV